MEHIFTAAYSEEEVKEIWHFIMSKCYGGEKDDSFSNCATSIRAIIAHNKAHHKDCIYIGVSRYRMVVACEKRALRRAGFKYIEKKRIFYELLGPFSDLDRKENKK